MAPPRGVNQQFLRKTSAEQVGSLLESALSSAGPRNESPFGISPDESISIPPSTVDNPYRIKVFEIETEAVHLSWQLAHAGSDRCCSMRCRNEMRTHRRSPPLLTSANCGKFGGGGGGGIPRICSRTNFPRFTGEVRVGLDGPPARWLVNTPPREWSDS